MNTSLRSKLQLSFLVIVLGLIILAAITFITTTRTNATLRDVFENDFKPYQRMANARVLLTEWTGLIDKLVTSTDSAAIVRYEQESIQKRAAIQDFIREYLGSAAVTPEGKALLTDVQDKLQALVALRESISEAIRQGTPQAALGSRIEALNAAIADTRGWMADFLRLQERQFLETSTQAQSAQRRALWLISGVTALILLLSLYTAGTTTRLVGRLLSRVQGTTQDLAVSSNQIVATTSQLTASAVETGTAVNQVTSTVEQTRQTARLSSEKAQYVSDSAMKVSQVSVNGRKVIEQSIESMKAIQHEMRLVAQSIMKLSEQSQAVGQIIGSVNELAEATNILSVNASIEAARAGEQGRGFAVVAQEIRNLAERSKQATGRIREILTDIQKATSATVLITEQAGKKVELGVQQSGQTGESMQVLSNSITAASQAALQIAASSNQQLAGMDQVAEAMNSINQASQQNIASLKQLEGATRNLNELGERLKNVVSVL